jgi:hypothetical protein
MSGAVADLLAAARAAHQRYRDNLLRRVNGVLVDGDRVAARAALADAYAARTAAIADDPEQNDPAWQDEAPTFDNAALLTFYREQLGRP